MERLFTLLDLIPYKAEHDYDTINPCGCVDGYMGSEDRTDMSIAIALVGTDGIVIATDSRVTRQEGGMTYHQDNSQKLWGLIDERVGIMTHGYNSGYRHFLIEYFKARWLPDIHHTIKKLCEQGKTSGMLDFMTIVDQFAYGVGDHIKHFANKLEILTSRYNANVDFVLTGYQQSIARIVSVSSDSATPFAPKIYPKSYFGGVNEIGTYWQQKLGLDNLELPIEFLKKFAVMVILETVKTSDMCGEPIQMAVINTNGFQPVAMIDDKGNYHDKNGEIENIKSNLDYEHKWLFDYLKKQE